MTTIMQIYLTILLGLIVLKIISSIIYKIASDSWYHDIVEAVFGIINIISFILTSSWGVYIVLAIIWHWY